MRAWQICRSTPYNRTHIRTKLSLSVIICPVLLVSCSKKQSDLDQPPALHPAIKLDPLTASSIHGRVKFEGGLPNPQKIDMTQDPACGNKPNYDESVVVNSGALQNVFVYVKSGLNGGGGMRDEPVTIKQQGCRYEPHVLGAMVDQRIDIINADETTHNIHPMPTAS